MEKHISTVVRTHFSFSLCIRQLLYIIIIVAQSNTATHTHGLFCASFPFHQGRGCRLLVYNNIYKYYTANGGCTKRTETKTNTNTQTIYMFSACVCCMFNSFRIARVRVKCCTQGRFRIQYKEKQKGNQRHSKSKQKEEEHPYPSVAH